MIRTCSTLIAKGLMNRPLIPFHVNNTKMYFSGHTSGCFSLARVGNTYSLYADENWRQNPALRKAAKCM